MIVPYVPAETVLQGVACRFHMTVAEITGPSRFKRHIRARFAAAWILLRTGGDCWERRSLPNVGKLLGGRDHSTVIHARDGAERMMERDPDYAETVLNLLGDLISGVPIVSEIKRQPEPASIKRPACVAILAGIDRKRKPRNQFEGCAHHARAVMNARRGADRLLAAIATAHPERIPA